MSRPSGESSSETLSGELLREMERRATLVRSFHPSVIIGNLHTRALATAVFYPDDMLDAEDAARAIDARMERGDLVRDPGRQWRMLQTEQALRWPVQGYRLHADQLDHIADVAEQPNLSFRVIPLDTIAPTTALANGFHISPYSSPAWASGRRGDRSRVPEGSVDHAGGSTTPWSNA